MPGFSPSIVAAIERQAQDEIAAEDMRLAIDSAKIRLREAKQRERWWHRFFPYSFKFHIERLPNGID